MCKASYYWLEPVISARMEVSHAYTQLLQEGAKHCERIYACGQRIERHKDNSLAGQGQSYGQVESNNA